MVPLGTVTVLVPRFVRGMTLAVLLAVPAVARGYDAILAVESPAALLDKVVEVMRVAAPGGDFPEDGDALVDDLTSGPLAGVDLDRPVGAFADVPETAGGPGLVAVAIPITSLDELLGSLEKFGADVEREREMPGFSHRVSIPLLGGVPLFVVATRDYAYFTPDPRDPAALKATRSDDWVADRADAGDVSLTLQLDALPREFVDMFLEQVEVGVNEQSEQFPDEDEIQRRGRELGQRLALEGMTRLVRDSRTLTVDLSVDRDEAAVAATVRLAARRGSRLAAAFTGFDRLRSRFSAIAPDAPLAAWMALPVPEEFRDYMWQSFQAGLEQVEPQNAAQRRLLRDAVTVAEELFQEEVQDVGVAMLAPTARNKTYSLAMAAALVDGRAVNDLLVRVADMNEDAAIQPDAGRAGDGTPIHRLDVPVDDEMNRIYGDAAVWVGFHDDAVAVGLGEGKVGRTAVDRGLAAASDGRGSDAPIGAVLRIAGLAGLDENELAAEVAEATFRGENEERDRIEVLVGGKREDLRVSARIDAAVIAFFANLGGRFGAEAVGAE